MHNTYRLSYLIVFFAAVSSFAADTSGELTTPSNPSKAVVIKSTQELTDLQENKLGAGAAKKRVEAKSYKQQTSPPASSMLGGLALKTVMLGGLALSVVSYMNMYDNNTPNLDIVFTDPILPAISNLAMTAAAAYSCFKFSKPVPASFLSASLLHPALAKEFSLSQQLSEPGSDDSISRHYEEINISILSREQQKALKGRVLMKYWGDKATPPLITVRHNMPDEYLYSQSFNSKSLCGPVFKKWKQASNLDSINFSEGQCWFVPNAANENTGSFLFVIEGEVFGDPHKSFCINPGPGKVVCGNFASS